MFNDTAIRIRNNKTVNAVASARMTASSVCPVNARKASSGPYADELNPSAPSPTHARKAISEFCGRASDHEYHEVSQ